jgi:hypothetical protein
MMCVHDPVDLFSGPRGAEGFFAGMSSVSAKESSTADGVIIDLSASVLCIGRRLSTGFCGRPARLTSAIAPAYHSA